MKRYIIPLLLIVVIGGVFGTAYALSQPPSKQSLAVALDSLKTYKFTREIEFKQYRVYVADDGAGNAKIVRKDFVYIGKVVTTASVDLVNGIVTEREEFYINGSLVRTAEAVFDLNAKKISGTVTLANGTTMDVAWALKRYYGVDEAQATEMLMANLPTILLKEVAINSKNVKLVEEPLSIGDRILMGLGLKEKVFEYRFVSSDGREWRVFVTSKGTPKKFEYTDPETHMVIYISPSE